MRRGLTNPLRPWAGGGDRPGAIRWFSASDVIPGGWEPCDGSGFKRPAKYAALINAMNLGKDRWSLRNAGLIFYRSASDTMPPWGRGNAHYQDLQVWVYTTGGPSISVRKTAAYMNPNWGNMPDGFSYSATGTLSAWGMFDDGQFLLCSTAGNLYGRSIFGNAGGSLTALGSIGVALAVEIVRFGGRYFSATTTQLRRCNGAGAWGTWSNITPAGMTFPIIDLLEGQIGGVEVLAVVCADGKVWTTTDGEAFTLLPNPTPNPIAARSLGRVVYDGDGSWYSAHGAAVGGFQVYRSSDLANWVGVSHPVTSLRAIAAGGGVVALGGQGGVGVAFSADKGGSWTTVITSATQSPYSGFAVESIATNGGYLTSQQTDGTNQFMGTVELGQHKPRIWPVTRGGVEYSAYLRVR